MKHIKWNEVTWYSKLLALILFAALPVLGFYLGVRYEKAVSDSEVPVLPLLQSHANYISPPVVSSSTASSSAPVQPVSQLKSVYFSYPYPVTWQATYGAVISLTGVTLGNATSSSAANAANDYRLTLIFRVNSGAATFCGDYFDNYLKLVTDEMGDLAPSLPNKIPCMLPNTAGSDERVVFSVSPTLNEFVFNVSAPDGSQQTFFMVDVESNGSLKVEAAPTQG